MKLKSMKKVLAAALSTTMVMGMSMTALASGTITGTTPTKPVAGGSITAPIYSYDTTNVVVPTSYGVAFNPDGLNITVSTQPAVTTTSTIASKNYGIINKSSKDKLVKVGFNITSTEPTESVTFVDTKDAATTDAEKGEYKIYLEVVPADTTDVQIYDASGNPEAPTTQTAPSSLAHVKMDKATSTVPMRLGDNQVAFKLGKATYALKGGSLDLDGSLTDNDVSTLYEPKTLDTTAGVTGFTFDGAMNSNADWTKVSGKIEITPTYTVETTDNTVTVLDGTGAMAELGPQVSVSSTGLVTMTGLTADANFKALRIENAGGVFDADASPVTWNTANYSAETGGTVTCQLGDGWLGTLRGISGKAHLDLTDGTTVTTVITIP